MTDYEALLAYLNRKTDYEKQQKAMARRGALDLSRVEALMDALGAPHRSFAVAHIAGSKGKGTTAALMVAVLREAGLRVGAFTSPHLLHLGERVAIDGVAATEEELGALFRSAEPHLRRLAASGLPLTFFEILTGLAFLRFAQAKVDAAVIEVGLGGRLDSTNVVAPAVTVITSIDLEHTAILGDTLGAVAREKAGILERGVPLVLGPVDTEARAAILDRAREVEAEPVLAWGAEVDLVRVEVDAAGTRATLRAPGRSALDVALALDGVHIARNAALAVAASDELLAALGRPRLADARVADALTRVRVPGRFSRHSWRGARFRLDAAHTPASCEALAATWAAVCPGERPVVILGTLADKNLAAILHHLAALRPTLVIGAPCGSPRERTPASIAEAARQIGLEGAAAASVDDALALAVEAAQRGDGTVLVTGSIYLLGSVTAIIDS